MKSNSKNSSIRLIQVQTTSGQSLNPKNHGSEYKQIGEIKNQSVKSKIKKSA
jgi:hypothetical protein